MQAGVMEEDGVGVASLVKTEEVSMQLVNGHIYANGLQVRKGKQ